MEKEVQRLVNALLKEGDIDSVSKKEFRRMVETNLSLNQDDLIERVNREKIERWREKYTEQAPSPPPFCCSF